MAVDLRLSHSLGFLCLPPELHYSSESRLFAYYQLGPPPSGSLSYSGEPPVDLEPVLTFLLMYTAAYLDPNCNGYLNFETHKMVTFCSGYPSGSRFSALLYKWPAVNRDVA